jgi:O-antigen/teichoic acid export membrane protein
VSTLESTLRPAPSPDVALPVDETGSELKRGAFFNTIALLASNFRGVFTFLVARLLGPAVLGTFAVAWAMIDLISKIGIFGLDDAITTFVARSQANGDHTQSRVLFRLAVLLAWVQSSLTAASLIVAIHFFGDHLRLPRETVSALAVVLCALPGIALYRVSTSISRGMKVMKHDIYSRGMTEPATTTLALLVALAIGFRNFAPEVAAVVGTAASGVVAVVLASRLFKHMPARHGAVSFYREAKGLLGYSAPISAYQLLNTFILRSDVFMLGWFIGRAPGVTLVTVGVYSAVVDLASGLRKVNQAFNPIFAPVIAGMTATGDHERAAHTYARLAQWMLWILLPLVGAMALSGGIILMIYGPAFRQGAAWLSIVGIACATTAFVSLGETVIMVQRPRLNLLNSSITCVIAVGANLWLIPHFGAMGAAFGILIPYIVQGVLRYFVLRLVFRWQNPWRSIRPPVLTAIVALIPALPCRLLLGGIAGELTAGLVFVAIFGVGWLYHQRLAKMA